MTFRFMSTPMVAAAFALLASTPALAQFAKPEDAVKYRRGAMTVMGTHFGRVAAMANGRLPFDAKVAADNAEVAFIMSKLPFAGFVDNSYVGDTRALPKIANEQEKFRGMAAKMQEEMTKLNAAAKGGNLDAIKTAVGATGGSCKSCHDAYWKE